MRRRGEPTTRSRSSSSTGASSPCATCSSSMTRGSSPWPWRASRTSSRSERASKSRAWLPATRSVICWTRQKGLTRSRVCRTTRTRTSTRRPSRSSRRSLMWTRAWTRTLRQGWMPTPARTSLACLWMGAGLALLPLPLRREASTFKTWAELLRAGELTRRGPHDLVDDQDPHCLTLTGGEGGSGHTACTLFGTGERGGAEVGTMDRPSALECDCAALRSGNPLPMASVSSSSRFMAFVSPMPIDPWDGDDMIDHH
mmetsp:Transcript_2962/g.6940  ORF Transcript_2962/g.6940 Transcript_2962/m.6940 type:complete len:256 (+) Transcript_2962:1640-2407(+)